MAKTKGRPGPKPKYGEREEIHVLVPVDDLKYIRSVTQNTTEWVISAIQEKRERDSNAQPSIQPNWRGRAYRKFLTKSLGPLTDIDRLRIARASEYVLSKEEASTPVSNDKANELALRSGMTRARFIQEYMAAGHSRRDTTNVMGMLEQSYNAIIGSDQMRLTAYKAAIRSSTSYGGDTPEELNASLQRLVQGSGDMVHDGLISADEANFAIVFKTSFIIVDTKP